jgi:hypothetical protein
VIDLRLKGCGAFCLDFQHPLEVMQERIQLTEAPFNRSVDLRATHVSRALSNDLL